MADTSKCFSLVRGRAMRVTRLDACGAKVLGPDSQVVSKGFISVGLTAQTEEGEAISVTNANGDICINDEPAPKFTGYDVEVQFCGVNPDLIHLMTNQPMVTDSQTPSQGVGFRMNSDVDLSDSGFALELWSAVPAAACSDTGAASYGYFLVPFLKGGIIGDFTIENAAINFTLTGAKSKDGSAWGVGPYDVTLDDGNAASPLKDPINDHDHLHMELVQVPPPVAVCGAASLGVPATSATAGTPATLTPANSYPPATVGDAGSLTASPVTAWTAGQYVTLRDGSTAHWNGTAWVAGVA
jgi:hypothetical protein